MADDRTPFDSDYAFDPELSSEDDVLQELKRIIGETEGLFGVSGLESPPELSQSDSELLEEPVEVIRVASATISPLPEPEAIAEQSAADLIAGDDTQTTEALTGKQHHLEEIIKSIDEALEEATPALLEAGSRDAVSETPSQQERYLVFSLAGIKYAVPTAEVVEIGRVPSITPVPNAPDWLLGVTNRRGDILSVVDLRNFLGVKSTRQDDSARIVVVRSTGDELMAGMIVDQVNGMLNVAPGTVRPPAGPIDTGVTPYLVGLCEHKSDLVAVLDLELILASHEMRQFELV